MWCCRDLNDTCVCLCAACEVIGGATNVPVETVRQLPYVYRKAKSINGISIRHAASLTKIKNFCRKTCGGTSHGRPAISFGIKQQEGRKAVNGIHLA
jgi:hypothetical protein